VKVNVKFTLEQDMKGVEVYLCCFFNLGGRWGRMVNAMSRPFYTRESPDTHYTGG
jgi:hypothetical protein